MVQNSLGTPELRHERRSMNQSGHRRSATGEHSPAEVAQEKPPYKKMFSYKTAETGHLGLLKVSTSQDSLEEERKLVDLRPKFTAIYSSGSIKQED